MDINFGYICLIVVFGSLFWYGNETINKVPGLKPIISFLIIAISIICLMDAIGLMHGMHNVRVN